MVTKRQQKQMLDYLVEKLRNSHSNVEPQTREIISGINSSYIHVDTGIVLLVDQAYANNAFDRLYVAAKNRSSNVVSIIFKDGKTFFRNAAQKHGFKANDKSLKNYTFDQVRQMISFRPEENFLYPRGSVLTYYQPNSERLPEGIVKYQFENVRFDYSHIDSSVQFKPCNKDSDRIRIWTRTKTLQGNIRLDNGKLLDETTP